MMYPTLWQSVLPLLLIQNHRQDYGVDDKFNSYILGSVLLKGRSKNIIIIPKTLNVSEKQLVHRSFAALVDEEEEDQDMFGDSGERLDDEESEEEETLDEEEWDEETDEDEDDYFGDEDDEENF